MPPKILETLYFRNFSMNVRTIRAKDYETYFVTKKVNFTGASEPINSEIRKKAL